MTRYKRITLLFNWSISGKNNKKKKDIKRTCKYENCCLKRILFTSKFSLKLVDLTFNIKEEYAQKFSLNFELISIFIF